MAVFGDPSTIRLVIEQFSEQIPCVTHYKHNEVIISESRHLAVIYDLELCMPKRSWIFEEQDPLISPLTYDSLHNRFVALRKNKVSLYKCDNQKDSASCKLNIQPHCLLSTPSGICWAVFDDGTIKTLFDVFGGASCDHMIDDEESNPHSLPVIGKRESIHRVVMTEHADVCWLLIITKSIKKVKRVLIFCLNIKSRLAILEKSIPIKKQYDYYSIDQNGNLICVTENGEIDQITEDECKLLISLEDTKVISSCCVPDSSVLFLVVKIKNQHQVQAIDLKYLVCTSKIVLDMVPLQSYLTVGNNLLFVGCEKGLICIPFEPQSLSLANVMGKSVKSRLNSCFVPSSHNRNGIERLTILDIEKRINNADVFWSEPLIFNALEVLITSPDFSLSKERYLSILEQLLSLSYNLNNMISVLHKANMSIDRIAHILGILTKLLDIKRIYIVDWITVILDAYFKLIVFSRNEHVITSFVNVQNAVEDMSSAMDKLYDIKTRIEAILPNVQNSKNYSIFKPLKLIHPKYKIDILDL